jgi:hypothetical protein
MYSVFFTTLSLLEYFYESTDDCIAEAATTSVAGSVE